VIAARRHLRLALPFAVLSDAGAVHLVAGEDFRYTLRGPDLVAWLPSFLRALDGSRTIDSLIEALPGAERRRASELVRQLLGERVLVEALPVQAPERVLGRALVHGDGSLASALRCVLGAAGDDEVDVAGVHVLCEETLDERRALAFNRERLRDGKPWLWVSSGALSRAYVGPVFLPWRGPCYACLVAAFERLSPAPELRQAVRAHDSPLPRAELSGAALELVSQITRWKLDACAAATEGVAAAYSLHVLELGSLELTLHAVPVDCDCGERCFERRSPALAAV